MTLKTFPLLLVFSIVPGFCQQPAAKSAAPQQRFDSPDAAVQALINAASMNDVSALKSILGSSAKGILTSGDPKQDASERQEFAKIAQEKHHLEKSSMNSHVMVLLIGDQDWPFPIPLLEESNHWRFDPARGAEEVRARQVGENELDAIQACAAFVGVQQAYAMKKRSAAGTMVYAERIADSEVPKEFAQAAGDHPTRAYHGYYFRVLKQQGPNAPGGQHSYVLSKTQKSEGMIGGFAIVAWPAVYGTSGVHTFIVNQNDIVYEKDRGPRATPVASYDPDPSWVPVD